MRLLFLLVLLLVLHLISVDSNTGFWYGNSHPPNVQYDTVPYANFTVKVNRPFQAGPGDYLVKDPVSPTNELYAGNTINRQSFDTQFILDLNYAIGIDPDRVFVLQVTKGDVHFSWESSNVIVNFIMLERSAVNNGSTLLECIADLTNQIQVNNSRLYVGTNVTKDIDPLWGLEVKTWDVSLKLTYAIEVVGGSDVLDDYYLNQGSLGKCDDDAVSATSAKYCEFERFFEEDISRALRISEYRIQILFIKSASYDSVLVSFRVLPKFKSSEDDVAEAIANLIRQVVDQGSDLYRGNVTLRVDPTWGVSNSFTVPRNQAAKFTLKYYQYDPSRLENPKRLTEITSYDRCKANRRCNWGVTEHNQTTNVARFFHQLFQNGKLYETNLFLDFEDWRMGIRGFSWNGNPPPTAFDNTTIRGAHFWPFSQPSLGPDIPCYRTERNQGLILDRGLQAYQVMKQESLVDDLEGRIDWLEENIEVATMGPILRSRKDVRSNLTWVRADVIDWWENESAELASLSTSMCIKQSCYIMFNTSSLELTGAINATGVIRKTENGTETAVFTFNSIYLGPELKVILVGQRALCLVSKTTIVINTTIEATPGTLGGFQGGGSVARYVEDQLSDSPRPIYICDIGDYCTPVANFTRPNFTIISNNVNGPGSGNLRINAFMMKTSATYIQEVQNVTTSAYLGQTLSGGFVLMYKNYSTPIIPHDVSAAQLKTIIEANLNLVNPADNTIFPDRAGVGVAGIGTVSVVRSKPDSQEGFTWNITLTSAIGNSPQLLVKSYLVGNDSKVVSNTIQDGNELGGTFQLEFQGRKTRDISPFVSADELKDILLEDLTIVSTAFVLRTDPTDNCNDGLCQNGPYESHGLLWTIYVTTNVYYDDITPTSPTDPLSNTTGPYYHFSPIITKLNGAGANVSIYFGTSMSTSSPLNQLDIVIPFSLAFGGSGGSYGGHGGAGYGINPVGFTYNDKYMKDLLGGSGGCMRSGDLFEINSVAGETSGRGGHGGGAIELVASNDIEIGTFGKLIARGGDAEQSSQGGGGGGSGGGILISSGATIVINGLLDVTGGNGGFGGFLHQELAGGGGGGGRIALFADSITAPTENVIATGGKCGVYTSNVETPAVEFAVVIKMEMLGALNLERLVYIGETFIRSLVEPISVGFNESDQWISHGVIHTVLNMSVVMDKSDLSTKYSSFRQLFNTTADIAEVYITHVFVTSSVSITANPEVETATPGCTNYGEVGSVYTEAVMTTSMYVKPTVAAEGTSRALFMSNRETTNTSTGSAREAPFAANGPILPFTPSRPNRITYYTRTDGSSLSNKADFGTMFSLISRGEVGLAVTNVIGVYFGPAIMHGANFGSAVDEKFFLKRMVSIDPYPILSRWYKIDIRIQWEKSTYSILIDDTNVATNQPFKATRVDGIRLSVFRAVDVWFDEIYVGFDNTMGFQCPISLRTGTTTAAPVQRAWSFEEVHGGNSNGYTEYKKMTRHYNFLDTDGSIAFDGQGAISVYQDIKGQYADGDYPDSQGLVHAGALVYLTDSLRSKKTPLQQSYTLVSPNGMWSGASDGPGGAGDGRQFWYTEYSYESDVSPTLNGGIAACSSQDLVSWRFEGIVFHYTNLSDMVYGSSGPFYMERPKVLFNNDTQNYVMWAVMDHGDRDLAMSAIATSPYEDGPFLFVRSFFPDGNKTRDQVIFDSNSNSSSAVARTYYQTVEFIIPEAMMQPTWESAKSRAGTINYRSNYHRAFYHSGYDNYNDIYAQRWRKEDISYSVKCVNKITGNVTNVKSGVYNDDGFVCKDPEETKVIYGQGDPIITTRFVSPNDTENSWWRPTSVPNVKAQAWSSNYQDGYCGIRKLNDDFDEFDPLLADFVPVARGTCSNIADNPVHESMQDKLIGVLHVIVTRRAKYIAVSRLTPDYLDTTGELNVFEGEMETGDLISIIMESGQFGFDSGDTIQSTFYPPVRAEYETAVDYNTRFSQYIRNHNDRASYSLACVLDGVCPVNFKDQLTKGQY